MDQRFTVLYSGNMGYAQDLKTIVKAASLLSEYNIFFQFIGEGVCKSEIELLTKPLNNKIEFYNSQNRKDLIRYIKKIISVLSSIEKQKTI
ncbi:MAG: glycosyltransferase [Candidatus Neomarinimicrobiota bacterium]